MMLLITILAAFFAMVVVALPGPAPAITDAPVRKDASLQSGDCTSTECFYSYSKCYGTMTFITNCFTPCGTATTPPSYVCPQPEPTA
ncbi:hypothetical protein F4779DRAFT_608849 [Xylariaceae sp. FL0662B]|nr:hypothetical protein F4779DRAFT_608849 [Xylariaceae sp. FL0662B]